MSEFWNFSQWSGLFESFEHNSLEASKHLTGWNSFRRTSSNSAPETHKVSAFQQIQAMTFYQLWKQKFPKFKPEPNQMKWNPKKLMIYFLGSFETSSIYLKRKYHLNIPEEIFQGSRNPRIVQSELSTKIIKICWGHKCPQSYIRKIGPLDCEVEENWYHRWMPRLENFTMKTIITKKKHFPTFHLFLFYFI